MRDRDLQKYIFDAVEAINNLQSFTKNISLVQLEQIEFKWAVERGISIIGEALCKGIKIDKNLPISNLKSIIGMRHIVIHDYDIVEAERLSVTIKKHIPIFKQGIQKYLD